MGIYTIGNIDLEALAVTNESKLEFIVNDNGDVEKVIKHPAVIDTHLCRDILQFLNKLSNSKTVPELFSSEVNRNGFRLLTRQGERLKKLSCDVNELGVAKESYKLHPRLELFYQFAVNNHFYRLMDDASIDNSLIEKVSGLLLKLQLRLNSVEQYLNEVNFIKGPEKNYKSLKAHVNTLLDLYARLLVVRVDLAYLKEFKNTLTIDDVLGHRDQLLKKTRKDSLARRWVGYACRLEYAPQTGFHFHLVAFLDGSKYMSDHMAGIMIAEHWKAITGGKGRFYLCNNKANQYQYNGIGMVNYHDTEKVSNLMRAVAYLTKADKLAKLSIGGRRTFSRSIQKAKTNKRGRRRSKVKPSGQI